MTRVIFNGTIKGLRGRIGNLIFKQLPDGTTLMTQAPARKNSRQRKRAKLKRSVAQNEHNSRFREAIFYAKASQTHTVYTELAGVTPMKTAYNFALSDWFNAPEIHCIERKKGHIRVQASDNVMVTRVQVTLLDEAGSVLEKGEAVRGKRNWWEYAPQTEGNTIIVEAWDLPGNVTRSTL
jgi:hypothetical protein